MFPPRSTSVRPSHETSGHTFIHPTSWSSHSIGIHQQLYLPSPNIRIACAHGTNGIPPPPSPELTCHSDGSTLADHSPLRRGVGVTHLSSPSAYKHPHHISRHTVRSRSPPFPLTYDLVEARVGKETAHVPYHGSSSNFAQAVQRQ